ncbi:hypothetical protein ATE69_13615 [Sphingopyxis sp. H071]|nr:hypothetical protein ATE61_14315 [Sphingopyxis sp. H057]KTE50385.1 hypothetical protein ATE64_16235 [Sphingopyxis sp. H073]KTE52474.1 hypothetical protein ATE69_13615 [Sphingopyxis sp. H071]KTE62967.1 hypothetical protein ATE66_01135 [Sphingopyxis sp. H107]KTE72199.1 hypothetical protein ATE60_10365 [Sphingopyxis sp. H081]KTE79730.1 hypothetical protein ATE63_13785 [Sphingopyxis sp. H067]
MPVAAHDAGDMPPDIAIKRGRPGDKLKPQPIVYHREPLGGEGDALSDGASHIVTGSGRLVRKTKLCRQLLCMGGDLALLQALQQIAHKDYALPLTAGKSGFDQMSGTCLHCLGDLGPKADTSAFQCLLRYKLTVEPCGAGCPNLLRQIHIGSHR